MELLLLVYRNRIKPQRKLIFVYETGVRLFNAQFDTQIIRNYKGKVGSLYKRLYRNLVRIQGVSHKL
jgi:hypothetical protein